MTLSPQFAPKDCVVVFTAMGVTPDGLMAAPEEVVAGWNARGLVVVDVFPQTHDGDQFCLSHDAMYILIHKDKVQQKEG